MLDLFKESENHYIYYILRIVVVGFQFVFNYLLLHTLYWIIEQIRYNICISNGFMGYFQSLIKNQSHVCIILSDLSNMIIYNQTIILTTITGISGIKYIINKNNETNIKK